MLRGNLLLDQSRSLPTSMHLLPFFSFSLTSLLFPSSSLFSLCFYPFSYVPFLLFPLLFPSPPPLSPSLFPFLISFLPFSLFLSFSSLCSFSRTCFHHSSLFPAITTNHHRRKQQPSSPSLINPTFAFSLSFSSPFSFLLPSLPHPQPLISPPSSPFPATTTNHHRLKQQPSSPSLTNPTEDKPSASSTCCAAGSEGKEKEEGWTAGSRRQSDRRHRRRRWWWRWRGVSGHGGEPGTVRRKGKRK